MRALSLVLAGAAAFIGLVLPFLLAAHATGLNQSILVLMMAGVAGGFVHGAGFRPERRWARAALSPWVTWPLIAGCLGGLLLMR